MDVIVWLRSLGLGQYEATLESDLGASRCNAGGRLELSHLTHNAGGGGVPQGDFRAQVQRALKASKPKSYAPPGRRKAAEEAAALQLEIRLLRLGEWHVQRTH
jgi:hypothetical protein